MRASHSASSSTARMPSFSCAPVCDVTQRKQSCWAGGPFLSRLSSSLTRASDWATSLEWDVEDAFSNDSCSLFKTITDPK